MKYLLAIILCITCYGASAQQNWYIPSDTTAKFKYAVYNQNGQIISYSIARVDSVYKADNRWIVRQSSTLYNARMQPTGAVLYAESYVSNDTTYLAINVDCKVGCVVGNITLGIQYCSCRLHSGIV